MINEHGIAELLNAIEPLSITAWIGGGWGVDALIGHQTRPHNDIDVYIEKRHAGDFIGTLKSKGYAEVKTDYTTPSHTIWQDAANRIVDVHLIEFKEEEPETLYFEGEAYPACVLNGNGTIGGVAVRCFTAEAQLLFHQGYEPGEKDRHDVLLLCKTYGLDVPEGY